MKIKPITSIKNLPKDTMLQGFVKTVVGFGGVFHKFDNDKLYICVPKRIADSEVKVLVLRWFFKTCTEKHHYRLFIKKLNS